MAASTIRARLISKQELAVIGEQLVADAGRAVVGREVLHARKDLAGKVDAPFPAVAVVLLIVDKAACPDDLAVEAEDVDRRAVAVPGSRENERQERPQRQAMCIKQAGSSRSCSMLVGIHEVQSCVSIFSCLQDFLAGLAGLE